MSRVYVFLADGFEEIEALTVVDLFRRADISTETVSIEDTTQVVGSHGIRITADRLFHEQTYEDAELLVLPGGMPGTLNLGNHEGLCRLLEEHYGKRGKIAAICAAPTIFGKLGFLWGRWATCYPGFEDQLGGAIPQKSKLVVDGNVTTARSMGAAIDFSLKLIAQLSDGKTAEKVRKEIVYGR